MAFSDILSPYLQNYAGQQEAETEMGNVKPKSTTINYNDDGSVDMTHKQTIAPVSPTQVPQVAQPQQPQQQPQPQFEPYQVASVGPTPAPPQRPVAPRAVDPNAYIAQQESGNNPNIGYHYPANAQGQRQSSAYGTYGITAPAYKDVQRADPSFQGRDITSLSPEEQTRANDVYRGEQSKQLQAAGVEPTPENLRLSQFLGAQGAANYLRDGSISPQAAQANGGEEKVRQIAQARLAGGNMPTSGAAVRQQAPVSPIDPNAPQQVAGPAQAAAPMGPPTPVTGNAGHDALISAGNDYNKLVGVMNGNYSEDTKRAAASSMRDLLGQQLGMADAQKQITQALSSGDNLMIAKKIKSNEPSYFKAAMLKMAGLDKASDDMLYEMGVGASWKPAMVEDKNYSVYSAPNGKVIQAIDRDTGREVTDPKELSSIVANNMAGAKHGGANMVYDAPDGTAHVINEIELPNGQKRYFDATDRKYLDKVPANVRHVGQENPMEKRAQEQSNRERSRLENENLKAQAQNAPAPFSAAEIDRRSNAIYNAVKSGRAAPTGGAGTTGSVDMGTANVPPSGAPGQVASPLRAQALEIYEGRQPMPTGMGANNYRNRAILDEVNKIATEQGKPYDATAFKKNKDISTDTEKKFSTGQQGNAVRSMNVAIDHMDSLRSKIEKLPNGQYPVINDIVNRYAKEVGDPRINSFEAMSGVLAAEVTKAIVANGGTGDERAEKEKLLAAKNSPEQLRGVLDSYTKLLGGQLRGLKEQYIAGRGESWDAKVNDRTNQAMAESRIDRPWTVQDKEAAAWLKANSNDPRAAKIKQRLGLD